MSDNYKYNNYNNYNNYDDEDEDDYDEDEEGTLVQKKPNPETEKKKASFLSKLITNIVMVGFLFFICASVFSIVSYCWKDTEQQNAVINVYDNNIDNFYYEKGFDINTVNRMQAHVETLPDYIKNIFKQDWIVIIDDTLPLRLSNSIVVVNNNDYDTTGLTLGGYTFTQPRVIYVNSAMGTEVAYDSFVHEVGHFVSFEYGSQHGSKDWILIYEKGYHTLDVSNYDKSNEAEFFASCYQLYFKNPEKLRVYLPEAHNYFTSLIQQPLDKDSWLDKYFIGFENTENIIRTYIRLFKKNFGSGVNY